MKSILVITDNFWIGGRETFLADNIQMLRKNGSYCISLLAGSIQSNEIDTLFDDYIAVGSSQSGYNDSWLSAANELIERTKPDFIWAQHFAVAPALLTASKHKLPLHITLHGPMSFTPYDFSDSLALSIALNRGASISAVSEEILAEITHIYKDANCFGVLPNKVCLPAKNSLMEGQQDASSVRFSLFSRQDKLEHLRQSRKSTQPHGLYM